MREWVQTGNWCAGSSANDVLREVAKRAGVNGGFEYTGTLSDESGNERMRKGTPCVRLVACPAPACLNHDAHYFLVMEGGVVLLLERQSYGAEGARMGERIFVRLAKSDEVAALSRFIS